MTIPANLNQTQLPFSVLTLHANAAQTQQTKNEQRNDIRAQIYTTLVTDLEHYSDSWNTLLRASAPLIDTTPAQNVLKAAQPLLGSLQSTSYTDWEIYDYVCLCLDQMQTEYMDVYAEVTEQYQLFMQDVNSFKSTLAEYMTADEDSVDLDMKPIDDGLNALVNKWAKSTPILTVDTQAEADYWSDQLGLPYKKSGSTYSFYVNIEPVYDMRDATNSLPDDGIISTARFNQWQNSINSSCSTIESDTQIIAQKYSQANTIFNNLAKILSSTMDALYQTDKEFLRN